MPKTNRAIIRLTLMLALLLPAYGCLAAAAGAGAAAGITLTNQGAESVVQGSIADVDRRTRAVLRDMGLTLADAAYEDNATEREYEARGSGDRVVHVKLEARGTTSTNVNVSSREGRLDYDKDAARDIISRIQRQN
jgi:hypothetical protein